MSQQTGNKVEKRKKSIKFKEDVSLTPHGIECILIETENIYQIDLGLLSSLCTYEVHFDLKHQLGKEFDVPTLQSPLIEVCSLKAIEIGHQVNLHVKCPESSILNEKLVFENSESEKITLQICSRIMPHHLGTPALKNGIRLLQGSYDTMSDITDWQGFD